MLTPTSRRFDYFLDTSRTGEQPLTRTEAIERHGIHAVHRAEHGLASVFKPIDPVAYTGKAA